MVSPDFGSGIHDNCQCLGMPATFMFIAHVIPFLRCWSLPILLIYRIETAILACILLSSSAGTMYSGAPYNSMSISYRTIVLSGGGSKGPYGVGVLLALAKWDKEHQNKATGIYIGTSVGALNAALAAQGNLTTLASLYSSINTVDILGTSDSTFSKWRLICSLGRKPYYYYENVALKKTICRHANFKALVGRHLIICTTNFKTGEPEVFYSSELIDQLLYEDKKNDPDKRRLINYHRITSQDELVNALLASAALPFYFPPVRIAESDYVDGGVGNNTPLRHAAYINRYIEKFELGNVLPVFCVINDPSRFTIDVNSSNDLFGVIRRTADIFQNEFVKDELVSWLRINTDVQRMARNYEQISSNILALDNQASEHIGPLKRNVFEALHSTNTGINRIHVPLMVVQPSSALIENILEFVPEKSKAIQRRGVADCLALLDHKNFITSNDFQRWNEEIE